MKKALLQLHAAVFLWGFTGVLGRLISLNEALLVWYRLLIAVITLWILYLVKNEVNKIGLRAILHIAGIGAILALHWVCFYGSIKYANVSIALTCLATSGLLSSIIEPLILRKRFDLVEILLGLFALAGIVIIYSSHLQFSAGIYLGLLAALLTVVVSVLNKRIIHKHGPEEMALYQLTGGLLTLSLLLPFYNHFFPSPVIFPQGRDWIWLLILSWVCTILTFYLYVHALKKISAFTMNLTLTLEPVYGIVLAFIIFKENQSLSEWFYAGFALIALAVAIHMWRLINTKQIVQPPFE